LGPRHIVGALLGALLLAAPACKDQPPTPAPAPEAAVPSALAAGEAPPSTPPALELGPADPSFAVLDLVFCTNVELRRCEGEAWTFPAGTRRVWAFLTLRCLETTRGVTVRWLQDDRERRSVRLHVGRNPRWRTWAFLDLDPMDPTASAGSWTVEVVHPDGRTVMARRRFFVER